MHTLIDISPPLSERLAVWPGDVPYRRDVIGDQARGDATTLSAMTATLHLGSHVDAPRHYRRDGLAVDELPLATFFGPCQVLAAAVPRGGRVTPGALTAPLGEARVLFKTGTFPDPHRFTTDFAGLSAELVHHAADAGAVLLGIDTPSVDPFDDPHQQSHHAAAARGLVTLEGLVLDHVAPGRYLLIALPLRLAGAEASPVRAALAPWP
jgi:arylformamidase